MRNLHLVCLNKVYVEVFSEPSVPGTYYFVCASSFCQGLQQLLTHMDCCVLEVWTSIFLLIIFYNKLYFHPTVQICSIFTKVKGCLCICFYECMSVKFS